MGSLSWQRDPLKSVWGVGEQLVRANTLEAKLPAALHWRGSTQRGISSPPGPPTSPLPSRNGGAPNPLPSHGSSIPGGTQGVRGLHAARAPPARSRGCPVGGFRVNRPHRSPGGTGRAGWGRLWVSGLLTTRIFRGGLTQPSSSFPPRPCSSSSRGFPSSTSPSQGSGTYIYPAGFRPQSLWLDFWGVVFKVRSCSEGWADCLGLGVLGGTEPLPCRELQVEAGCTGQGVNSGAE